MSISNMQLAKTELENGLRELMLEFEKKANITPYNVVLEISCHGHKVKEPGTAITIEVKL